MAPTKRDNGKINKQKCPVCHCNRHDPAKSGKRVLKAKTSPKEHQDPTISEISSSMHGNHPVPPDGENASMKLNKLKKKYKQKDDITQDPFNHTSSTKQKPISENILLSKVYDLVNAVLAYGCASDVLEQNGNLYCFKTRPEQAPKCVKRCDRRGCNQLMKRPQDLGLLHKIKQGRIRRKCRKCSHKKFFCKKHGALSGSFCNKHGGKSGKYCNKHGGRSGTYCKKHGAGGKPKSG